MNEIIVPRRRNNVFCKKLGSDLGLFDPSHCKIHILNHTACVIWNMCDGTNDSYVIAKKLAQMYDTDFYEVRSDVAKIIENLRREGLLEGEGLYEVSHHISTN